MGRALKAYGLFLLALVVLPLGTGYLYAWWWLPREEAAWANDFEPMASLLERYAKADASPAAKRLDALTRPLGIVFLGSMKQSDTMKALGEHVKKHQDAAEEGISPAPAALSSFLSEHAAEIEAIEELLRSGEEVSWPIDIETGYDAPLPGLLAHRYLQNVLLVKALEAARRGRAQEARGALEASWISNASMARRPELLSQLIGIAIAGMQAGVLRCLPERPEPWAERIVEHGFRKAVLTSLQLEAHFFGFFGRGFQGVTDIAPTETGGDPPRGAVHVMLRLLTAPYLKLSVAGYSERLRLTAIELKRRNPCEIDSAALADEATAALPRWNTIGKIALPGLIRAWQSVVVADLDAERTRVVIETSRMGSRGAEPFASEVCPGLTWQVTRDAQGAPRVAPQGIELPSRGPSGWTFRLRSRS